MPDHNKKTLSDEQIESMIAKAVAKRVPNICKQAAEAPIVPLEMVDDIVPRQYPRRNLWPRRLVAAVLLLCLCAGGFFAYTWFSVKAVISIDINPGISLSLNRYEYVINAQPLNDDGADVLDDLNLERLDLDTALNALIGAMNRKGYLSEGATASVFVSGEDEDYNQKLYREVSEDFAHLAPSMVTQQADSQQPSDDQQPQSNETQTDSTQTQQSDSPSTQQPQQSTDTAVSLEQAQQLALQKAGLSDSEVTWKKLEQDEDDGRIVYELEFISGRTEYDCEIDAATGNFLKFEQEQD
ncbi:PepSY domain-containing protein [uncultured Negativibacillus sp.]|uniref:PepSY domain-containing protein n=1 Tax=uncultured Negativibacillus sp. TaxID=1980696 RepID=UPI0025EA887C|nr:PepSY domain-containing protein [uncultured Negativibacillus sp.]